MASTEKTFWQFLWEIVKSPTSFVSGNPVAQSAAAFGINVWFLFLAVLAQFWVLGSAALLLAQTYNTWQVSKRRMSPVAALSIGLILVLVNLGALALAVLGQFWVVASVVLSLWQYWCLIQVCWRTRVRSNK